MSTIGPPREENDPDRPVGVDEHRPKSQPQPDSELVESGTPEPYPSSESKAELSRPRRAAAAVAGARDKTIRQLVTLLVPLIRATGIPLLVVVLILAGPAVTVMVIALQRPGADDGFWLILGAVGLALAGWLALRRRQLLAVARDPEALGAALASVVTGRDMWDQLVHNVSTGRVAVATVRRSRPLRILRGMWRGVQLTGVLTQITERPELLPLMPGRLRGMWLLVIACLIGALVLGLAVLMAGLLYLLGA